jgi:hypothetical protein
LGGPLLAGFLSLAFAQDLVVLATYVEVVGEQNTANDDDDPSFTIHDL